jgi:hypothetical protein
MRDELTNLLPPERLRALALNYYIRLGVVSLASVTVLTMAAAVLLIPSYVFLDNSLRVKQERLANMEAARSVTNESALTDRITQLSNEVGTLSALAHAHSSVQIARSILSISRTGIRISGFSYAPAVGKTPGTIALRGISQTRDNLRTYQSALQSAPGVASANLPVSAYAKDSNIDFTVTVTLAP